MSSAGKNIMGTVFFQVPTLILGIIGGIFLTRLLGPEGKGVYAVFFANTQLLLLFLGFSFNQGVTYFIANKKIPYPKVFGLSTIIIILASFMGFILIFTDNPITPFIFPEHYDASIFRIYLFLSFSTALISSFFSAFFIAIKRIRLVNILNFSVALLNFILFISLYVLHVSHNLDFTYIELFFILFFVILLQLFVYIIVFSKQPKKNISIPGKDDLKAFFNYIFLMYLALLFNFFTYRFSIWVIQYYYEAKELGYYALAYNFAQMSLLLTNAINRVAFPYYSSQTTIESRGSFSLFSRINAAVNFLIILPLIIFAETIIPFIYGIEFYKAAYPFQIMALAFFFFSSTNISSVFLNARGKVKVNTIISFIAFIFTIGLDFFLIPLYGISGAAYSKAMVFLLIFILYQVYLTYWQKIRLVDMHFIKMQDITQIKRLLKDLTTKKQ